MQQLPRVLVEFILDADDHEVAAVVVLDRDRDAVEVAEAAVLECGRAPLRYVHQCEQRHVGGAEAVRPDDAAVADDRAEFRADRLRGEDEAALDSVVGVLYRRDDREQLGQSIAAIIRGASHTNHFDGLRSLLEAYPASVNARARANTASSIGSVSLP